jgi:5-enolpyruvylshikimate-3-phosphate synthase
MSDACQALGAVVEVAGATIRVDGVGAGLRDGRHSGRTTYIWTAGSALVGRIFSVLGAAIPQRAIIDGNSVLRSRPFTPLFALLERHGVRFDHFDQAHCLPCSPLTHELPGGRYSLPTSISSQFATALPATAPLACRPTTLELTGEHYSLPYIRTATTGT